jgi:glycerol-3-phosphate dehydrogenase
MPAEVRSARRDRDGWTLEVESEGRVREEHARVIVNAAGPWAALVQSRLASAPAPVAAELVGGAHVELAGEMRSGIFYAEAVDDRRPVFVMPWKGHTLVGTTETIYHGDPGAVTPSATEIDYLERTFAHYFPGRPVERLDAWAGLRVLPQGDGSPNARPREVRLQVDDEERPGVLTIWGGKLTGYRLTAEKVMRRIAPALPAREIKARTSELGLSPVPG